MIFQKDLGVSPVIGVILLLGVTVSLVALASSIIFGFVDDSADPNAEIEISYDSKDEELTVRLIRNENIDTFDYIKKSGSSSTSGDLDINESGDSETITDVKRGDSIAVRGFIGSDGYVIETYEVVEIP